jgi:adenylate cyclase
VRAAVETQQAVTDHNADVPADRRIVLRIGINLGDVVIDGDDIQGDGVNLAARLESMAAPGGICVSGMVYEGVRDRIDVPFEDLGEQEIKNFDRPVRVWQWVADTAAATVLRQTDNPLPLPDKPSIAVLPFDNMSGDPDQDSFAEGLTEDLITDLSKVSGLFVVARNSSWGCPR